MDNVPVIKEHNEKLEFGNITDSGMPFYTGNIEYVFSFTPSSDGEYYITVPEFAAPLLAVFVDGVKTDLIAYKPHKGRLGVLKAGKHIITIRMYGNRHNGFSMLHPVGIMSKPIIERCIFIKEDA